MISLEILFLDHIHQKGVRHGDLSPSNIFFDRDGKAKIGDFGLASLSESGIFGEYSPRAIGAYCAPEVSEGNHSLSSDIYSLGIILLEMLRDFKTDMEKAQELQHFKDHSELLSPWHVDKKEEKMGFICLLTNSDPSLRPSTGAIISSFETLRGGIKTT